MSEFMMSEGLKRIILRSEQTDEELWNTVARLYRTYGTAQQEVGVVGTYQIRKTESTVDVVADGERFRFVGPTVIDDGYRCSAAHVRKLVDIGALTPVSTPCADCNGCGIRYYRSGDEPCGTCGGTGETSERG